jgi:hypothetical protein
MADNPRPYILIRNLFNRGDNFVERFLNLAERFSDSKVGQNVDTVKKRRRDLFLGTAECGPIDKLVFGKLKPLLEKDFGISIRYRERYKIGHYSEHDQGFYNPHSDTQGGMEYRKLSMVICFSGKDEYEGGEFTLVDLGKTFRFDYGEAIIFDSSLVHGVSPVTRGDRKVLISFLFDEDGGRLKLAGSDSLQGYTPVLPPDMQQALHSRSVTDTGMKYLFCIPPNSGPGNQIVSIKEAYAIARVLGRTLMLPPINQHYTRGNRLYWSFDEIFRIDSGHTCLPDMALVRSLDKCYLMHGAFSGPLRLESFLELSLQNVLMEKRVFRSPDELAELKGVNDRLICIKHAFNTVRFNTSPYNGVLNAPLNHAFLPWYREICEHLDFSAVIHGLADRYLKDERLDDFMAVHLRYPDVMGGRPLEEHAGFSEADIEVWLLHVADHFGFDPDKIFIATNKPELARDSALARFRFYPDTSAREYGSFIEQCICSKARLFVMSPWNDYSKKDEPWQRSTWSALVHEHRMFRQKLLPTQDILLLSIID